MRRTTGLMALIAVFAVVAAACTAASSPSAAGGAGASAGTGASATAPLTNPDLEGTEWILGDLPGQVLADVRPTVSFSGDGTDVRQRRVQHVHRHVHGRWLQPDVRSARRRRGWRARVPRTRSRQAYLAALQATTAYEITDAGDLKLTSGATTLTFTKAT